MDNGQAQNQLALMLVSSMSCFIIACQRCWEKIMFSAMSVILLKGGGTHDPLEHTIPLYRNTFPISMQRVPIPDSIPLPEPHCAGNLHPLYLIVQGTSIPCTSLYSYPPCIVSHYAGNLSSPTSHCTGNPSQGLC